MQSIDLLTLCDKYQFDYLSYMHFVSSVGDLTAIRKNKDGTLFRRNYERAILMLCVANKYQSTRFLEFGTGRGFVTACISCLKHVQSIFTIDKDHSQNADKILSSIPDVKSEKINFLCKNSMNLSSSDISHDFDLVFIDGEHSEKAAKNDFELALKCTTDNAIIVFDDYRNKHRGVKKFIKSLKFEKFLVFTDGWIYKNNMIHKHGDADKIIDGKEYNSGQVVLFKNHQE